jgi:hypothetical protein
MLYYIHRSLLPLNESKSRNLALLLMAAREGKHLVTGDREVLSALAASEHIGLADRAIAHRLAQAVTTTASLKNDLLAYIEVVDQTETSSAGVSGGQPALGRIPLHYTAIDDSAHVQASLLLVEGHLDGQYYELFVGAYVTKVFSEGSSGIVRLRFECDSGGGSGIAAAISRASASFRPAICIVDSDRSKASGGPGGTAKAAARAAQNLKSTHHYVELKCREVENFLPLRFLGEVANEGTHRDAFRQLMRVAGGCPALLPWMDLKKGLRVPSVYHSLEEDEADSWLGVQTARDCGDANCVNLGCGCWIVFPQGDRLLERVVNWVSDVGFRNAFRRDDFDDDLRAPLAALLLAWGCASDRVRT